MASEDDDTKPVKLYRAGTRIFQQPITSDMLLKTLGAVLLAICGYFLRSAWERIDNHEGRLVRTETRMDATSQSLDEVKGSLKEVNAKLDRIIESNARRNP